MAAVRTVLSDDFVHFTFSATRLQRSVYPRTRSKLMVVCDH